MESGRSNGQIFDRRQLCRARYRKAVRDRDKRSTMTYTNELHEALITKDGHTFWNCWRSKFELHKNCSEIEGCVNDEIIAGNFAKYFSAIYTPKFPTVPMRFIIV